MAMDHEDVREHKGSKRHRNSRRNDSGRVRLGREGQKDRNLKMRWRFSSNCLSQRHSLVFVWVLSNGVYALDLIVTFGGLTTLEYHLVAWQLEHVPSLLWAGDSPR